MIIEEPVQRLPHGGEITPGGSGGGGTVFKVDLIDMTLTTIWSFTGGSDGGEPQQGTLIVDQTGALYGTTYVGGSPGACGGSGCGTVFKLSPPMHGQTAWTLTSLWSFSGAGDGANPNAGLIADTDGALYGTTSAGGASR